MAKAKPLALTTEDRELLEALIRTRTIQASIMNRARIILLKADGESIDSIADKVGLNRNSVLLCLRKFKEGGVSNAIYDASGRGRPVEITDDEKHGSLILHAKSQPCSDTHQSFGHMQS